jgi:hypothetical protein
LAAALLLGLTAACTSSATSGNRAGTSQSASESPVTESPVTSISASASATFTGGHCSVYPRSQAAALIGTPNITTGLPRVTAPGGTQIDTCMYGHADIASRSGSMLGYGVVRYSNDQQAASAVHAALHNAESSASGPAREFPAPGLPAGTRDGVWQASIMPGIPAVTLATVVSNVHNYVVWSDGGGTVAAQRAEQIAITVAEKLVSHAGG